MQQQVESIPTLHGGDVKTMNSIVFLKKSIDELVDLCVVQQEAAERLYLAVKEVAEPVGLKPSLVMKLVKAKASDKFVEKKNEIEQLAMIFEECS